MTNTTLSSEEFIRQTEAFAAALQKGDLTEAQAIDNQLIGLVGTEGRVDLFRKGVPIRPLLGYSFNRAILRLHQGRIEEAAFCMNDTTRSLFYSRMHQDIYFLLDCLAESRGQHDIFSSPFETACDYLMMGVITQPYFQAMSLSFLWKAKTIYIRLGHADMGGFVEELIGLQCSMVAARYKAEDPDGAQLFEGKSKSPDEVKLRVPKPNEDRKLEWKKTPYDGNRNLTAEERKNIFGQMNPHHQTVEEERMLSKNWPRFSYPGSLIEKRCNAKKAQLPNILEVMEMLCYEEEKYAIRCGNDGIVTALMDDVHDWDGNLDQVVGEDGMYLFLPKGIINDVYYRGQAKYFEECKPSLYRNKSGKDIFVERVKLCEFSILIGKHPSAKLFEEGFSGHLRDGSIESHEMLIDVEALAQHYGILTEYIDLTADKWVAAFFACTDYHHGSAGERDTYVKHTASDSGVVYLYHDKKQKKYSGELHPVGLQPFSRPVAQAGYVMKMKGRQNFNKLAHPIRFRHDSGCTSIVYWLFDQSMKIQPEEVIERKAKRIVEEKQTFSRDAVEMAHVRYYRDLDDVKYAKMVKRYGLLLQEAPLVDFSVEELEKAKQEFGLQNGHLMRTVMRREMMMVKLSDLG